MPGRIDGALKEELKEAGQWEAFQSRRDELKAEGHAPNYAHAAALREATVSRGDGSTTLAADLPDLPHAPPELEGRSATEPEVVRWVANNIDVLKPNPAKCPSPFAWTLLRQCRGNAAQTAWFVDKLWSKLIPSRSQLEQGGPQAFDGEIQQSLIHRIQGLKDKAEGRAPRREARQAPEGPAAASVGQAAAQPVLRLVGRPSTSLKKCQ